MADDKLDQRALFGRQHTGLENVVVLYLMQAMLGLLGPSVKAVAVEVRPECLVVHFAMERLTDEEREDVEDVVGDLDALLQNEELEGDWKLAPGWTIEPAVYVGPPDESWPGCPHRRVFEAKPST